MSKRGKLIRAVLLTGIVGALGAYGGIVAFQAQIFDQKVEEFKKYDSQAYGIEIRTIKKTFFSRTLEISHRLKEFSHVPIRFNAETKFGFYPKIDLFAFGSEDQNVNAVLTQMDPKVKIDCGLSFLPVKAVLNTQESQVALPDSTLHIGEIHSDLLLKDPKIIKVAETHRFAPKAFDFTLHAKPIEITDSQGTLRIGSQALEFKGKFDPNFASDFGYRIEKSELKGAGTKINWDHVTLDSRLTPEASAEDSQNIRLHFHDVKANPYGIKFTLGEGDIEFILTRPTEISMTSALMNAFAEDCRTSGECVGLGSGENLVNTTWPEFIDAVKAGKVQLNVLPSVIKGKDFNLALAGDFVVKENNPSLGTLNVNLKMQDKGKLAFVKMFMPKNSYKQDAPDELSTTVELQLENNQFKFLVNGNKF